MNRIPKFKCSFEQHCQGVVNQQNAAKIEANLLWRLFFPPFLKLCFTCFDQHHTMSEWISLVKNTNCCLFAGASVHTHSQQHNALVVFLPADLPAVFWKQSLRNDDPMLIKAFICSHCLCGSPVYLVFFTFLDNLFASLPWNGHLHLLEICHFLENISSVTSCCTSGYDKVLSKRLSQIFQHPCFSIKLNCPSLHNGQLIVLKIKLKQSKVPL